MVNWKKLRQNIPNTTRAKAKEVVEILWIDEFKNGDTYGETRFNPTQIVINKNQSDKEAIFTLFHEFLHLCDDTYEVGLTEKQVRKLEKAFPYLRELVLTLEGKE